MKFDLVIKNGTIFTMDNELSTKRWLAVKNGKIEAIGDRDDFMGEADRIVDLKGKVLMPGFIDSHAHSTMTGIGQLGVDLAGLNTVEGVLDAVSEFCSKNPGDKVLCGCNLALPSDFKDGRVPTRYELDEVTGNRATMLVFWTAHGGILNSKAVEKAKLPNEYKYVEKDGLFNEDEVAFYTIGNIYDLLTDDDYKGIYHNIAKHCASQGITTIHSLDGMMVKNDRDSEILNRIINTLPIDVVPYTQTFDVKKIQKYGYKQMGGCLSIDGSPPQLTAAHHEPYPCAPHTRGFLNFTDKELYDVITEATKAEVQIGFHAIGDRAVDQIVHIYQQVHREIGISHLRHRIEHFSLHTDENIAMAAEMNLVASVQPAIGNMLDKGEEGNLFEKFVSKEKAQRYENFSYLVKGGIIASGGSDSPVTPIDALYGIGAATNPNNPARKVSMDDALKMYTINGAWACHQEKIKGSLEVGKQADMVILDKSLYDVDGTIDSSTVSVVETIRKGISVFEK